MSGSNGKSNGIGHSETLLDLRRIFSGRKLLVVGGTGFLGKVWWSLLLSRYPQIGPLYLVVRSKGDRTSEQRFWEEIAVSPALGPLRDQYGDRYSAFLREKIVPIEGDIVRPFCGIAAELREELRGEVAAVVNASGIVDFEPPLDLALEVNAFGVQNLVALTRDLESPALLHTSTCFVAGGRTGFVEETDPLLHPFPRLGELVRAHWDPDREITECLDIIEQAKHRASDAFRQSHFLSQAQQNLSRAHEPATGATLEAEIARVRRKYIEERLAEMGKERARFWGWANTYTYTKSIGEQIAARSGLRYTIVRPAIIESSLSYPCPGWNEGINTSAPLIYTLRAGQQQMPGSDHNLDMIPCDMVASGMILALAELLDGSSPTVYQLGASDSNPVTMARIFELTGLYKRRYYQQTGAGGPILSRLHGRLGGHLMTREGFERFGPSQIASGARQLSRWLKSAAPVAPLGSLLEQASQGLEGVASEQEKIARLYGLFAPFTAEYDYTFRSDHVRRARARLLPEDRRRLNWEPETIDWRKWFLEIHMPGLEKWVFPEIEKKRARPPRAGRAHETLTSLLDEMARRHDLGTGLERTEALGQSRISFREWRERSLSVSARLGSSGVKPGDRVGLGGANHPSWPIAFFGILYAGATVVPLDAQADGTALAQVMGEAGLRVALLDPGLLAAVRDLGVSGEGGPVELWDLHHSVQPGPLPGWAERALDARSTTPPPRFSEPGDVAVRVYTSDNPNGVTLSHQNLTQLIAALGPLFPLGPHDRLLSVLPLHHTFELTCGLLLPLSRGARVIYLDEPQSERVLHGLRVGQATAIIGVPAVWERLERRLLAEIGERGFLATKAFDMAVLFNRTLGQTTGIDLGRSLFGPVHRALGGRLRYLVSGGAGLPRATAERLAGLGLHLSEGYGPSDAAPVISVRQGGPRAKSGHVGRAVPGVEIRIMEPGPDGVGEVLVRGAGVTLGCSHDPRTTGVHALAGGFGRTIDGEGYLHTGDLGKLDRKGNLVLVGRTKETGGGGTFEALPKGPLLPRRRELEARIGPLLRAVDLKRLTAATTGSEQYRRASRFLRDAVVALSRGSALDLSRAPADAATEPRDLRADSLEAVFQELPARFRAGAAPKPICYYFSLGDERWTVQVTPERCDVIRGKAVDVADCVLKTSPDLFTRIVREAYSPGPGEFISGRVKSNNIPALVTFQKVFQLTP